MAVRVLSDQLSHTHGPLARRDDERVLVVESHSFARRHASHPHELTLLFSVVRHFRDELRERGREMTTRGEL